MKIIKIAHILYFTLLMLFFVFVYIFITAGDTQLHTNMLLLYTFLLLPIWDMLFQYVSYKQLGKLCFIVALGLFLYVALYLVLGMQNIAEGLSILAYYALILGVVIEIIEAIIINKIGNKNK